MIRCERAILVGTVIGLWACGGQRASVLPEPDPEVDRRWRSDLTVEVQNHDFLQATIYAYTPGHRLRVGVVEGKTTQTFTFEWPLNDLRFMVDYLASGCTLTESLPVDAEDQLLLIIRNNDSQRASRDICRA